jgi:hypothetical protein
MFQRTPVHFLKSLLAWRKRFASDEISRKYTSCYGRADLFRELVSGATHSACVLLFGGRQSGKTTILRALEDSLSSARVSMATGGRINIPVYVDLMTLPYDATPVEFFQVVSARAIQACSRQVEGFNRVIRSIGGDPRSVERFRVQLITARDAVGMDLHFIFLIDEAKRVLGTRFPRGFQDNLFSLMFGSAAGPYSFILVGAQELYKLSEDTTSPIGSRAAKRLVCNLPSKAVGEIVRSFDPLIDESAFEERKALIYTWTSGHAGLSVDLARRFACHPEALTPSLMSGIVNSVRLERSELFQIWAHGLSLEARAVHEVLIRAGRMTLRDVAACLRSNTLPPYRADRVSEELRFTGIATREGDELLSGNLMYTETARNYVTGEVGTTGEQEVWALIGEVEIGLRRLIRKQFERKWPGGADHQIRKVLGEQAWASVMGMRDRNENSYSSTPRKVTEVLDCAYLGQLGQLMKSRATWSLFRDMFRDVRELEDMLRDVTPVRNDCAHFRTVPERELDRCKLRCEDLLAVIARKEAAVE